MTRPCDPVVLVTGGSAGIGRVTVARLAADRAILVERVLQEHGRLDAVVLNAGLGWAGLLEDMPGQAIEDLVALTPPGAIELPRLPLPHLLASARERGRADVVAVSSVAAWTQVPPLTVYS